MAENPDVRGCIVPLDLYYNVGDHTWMQVNDDGTVTVGMTDVAQNLAGPLLHAKTKKVGTVRKKGKPIATVESGKWVGPVKSPVSGEIVEVNEDVVNDAKLINLSPYKRGWIVKMRPDNLDEELQEMTTGDNALEAYRKKIEEDNIKGCEHLEGFEE
ncbi:MAG: glycine cleavage system protein GcvH [bacterium]